MKALSDHDKLLFATALVLLKDYRHQCLDLDWIDAVRDSSDLAGGLGIDKEFSSALSSIPAIRMKEA